MSGVLPKIINLSSPTPNNLNVQWELIGNSQGYTLSKFYLYETDNPTIPYEIGVQEASRNDISGSFVQTVTIVGFIKEYYIKAYYTYNDGAASYYTVSSNVMSYTVYGTPSKPIIKSFSNNFPRRMDIIWSSVNSVDNQTIKYIDVSYSNASYPEQTEKVNASNPLIISDISKGSYSVQIKTTNTSGFESAYSDISNITIYDIPSKPSFDIISDISLNTINIKYGYNDTNNAPIISANYQFNYNGLTYNKDSPTADNSFNAILSDTSVDLIYGNTYTDIKFRLTNRIGSSLFSDPSSYTPNTIPSNMLYRDAEPFDGSYITGGSYTRNDCSSLIFFSCRSNGSAINEISGNFVDQNSQIISGTHFNITDISYIIPPDDKYRFLLPGFSFNQNNYIKFNCRNSKGYAEIPITKSIFFPIPVISPVSIYEITTTTITFKTLFTTISTYSNINTYDTIKYSFRIENPIKDGSSIIPYSELGDLLESDKNYKKFSISDPSFNGTTINFSFWLKNQGLTSQVSSNLIVYMKPPSTPFISILPVGQNIQVSYYTNISTAIKKIIYDISGVYNERGVEYNPIDGDLPFQFNIQLPPISERSATQSYSVRAKFINMFGESEWSNYAYINNDSITEYTTSKTNCRYISVTPANRFEVISPYDFGFTKEELDSRRKYEVLQYFGNSSTSNVKNNFTNKQRYALASRGNYIRNMNRAQGITTNNFSCVVEPSGFFNIPLYNYTVNKQYDKYEELPSPKQWYMNYVKNQEFENNTENKMLSIYVNKFIRSSSSDINIRNSIFIDLSGTVRDGYFDKTITYTITSCEVKVYKATSLGSSSIHTYNVRLTQNPLPARIEGTTPFVFNPVEGSPKNFRVIYYCGDLDFTIPRLQTANGDAYDITCKFFIERQIGANIAIIDNPIIRVITAGRSVIL